MEAHRLKFGEKYNVIFSEEKEIIAIYTGIREGRHMFVSVVRDGNNRRAYELGIHEFNLIDKRDVAPTVQNDLTLREILILRKGSDSKLEAKK